MIDTDLGISGQWGVARAGFTELVARVCTGEVGAIFGIEISRLARSNADVARLAEFARITDTLLIDADGVYDPADVNDRVLLGLKGTMGEMELHVMAQRLQADKRAAAERGELRTPLPVGYVHDEAGEVVIDPDAEVEAAIADLFAAFAACGSAYGVVAAFAGRRFPLRAYGGAWAGQLRWGKLTHARVLGVLKNPGYAGAYVHGRYASRRTVDPDGTVHTAIVERPRAEWPVLINDHHEGYISLGRLPGQRGEAGGQPHQRRRPPAAGRRRAVSGHHRLRLLRQADAHQLPRRSPARLRVLLPRRPADHPRLPLGRRRHRRRRGRRACCWPRSPPSRSPSRWPPPTRSPTGASASAGPPSSPSNVPATRPTAPSAPSAPVEPENRLVARSLEARWEARLADLAEAEQALDAAQTRCRRCRAGPNWRNSPPTCPALWNAPATSNKDRKRLLRTLIADVTLLPEPDHAKARIGIRWHTGATDELTVARAIHSGTAKRSPSPAVEMVRELGPGTTTAELAGQLNAAGLTTGTGRPFDVKAVQWIRHAYHIPAPAPYADGEISVADAAHRLGCSTSVVYDWIKTGKLDARRGPGNRLCIPWTEHIEADCRRRITESGHLNPAARRTRPGQAGR